MLVSLGAWCDTAWQIENFTGKQQWGPFNSLGTPLQSIPRLLEERFEFIADERYLEYIVEYFDGKQSTSIFNRRYEVFLHHDFTRDAGNKIPKNWRDELGRISARWNFALEKWYAATSKSSDLVFIRGAGNYSVQKMAPLPTMEADYLSTLDSLRTIWPHARLATVNPECEIASPELKTANIRKGGSEDWNNPADYWKGAPSLWKPFLLTLTEASDAQAVSPIWTESSR